MCIIFLIQNITLKFLFSPVFTRKLIPLNISQLVGWKKTKILFMRENSWKFIHYLIIKISFPNLAITLHIINDNNLYC